MNELMLFTDGSVNTRSKKGFGAYLLVSESGLAMEDLKALVKVQCFEPTSSTKLELQMLLWALKDIQTAGKNLIVYTDSQNIVGLPGRRDRLEKNEYRTKNGGYLNNYELYREFYQMMDKLAFTLVKVEGHKTADRKNDIDRLFTLVDRASRNALRREKS